MSLQPAHGQVTSCGLLRAQGSAVPGGAAGRQPLGQQVGRTDGCLGLWQSLLPPRVQLQPHASQLQLRRQQGLPQSETPVSPSNLLSQRLPPSGAPWHSAALRTQQAGMGRKEQPDRRAAPVCALRGPSRCYPKP